MLRATGLPDPAYLNVLIVEQSEPLLAEACATGRRLVSLVLMFNIELRAFPRDSRLVVLSPQADERAYKDSEANAAINAAHGATSRRPVSRPEAVQPGTLSALRRPSYRNKSGCSPKT